MVLLYPHTLEQYKERFEILEEIDEESNPYEEWNKIKLKNIKKIKDNDMGIIKKFDDNTLGKKSIRDVASQTNLIFKKNQETSPLNFPEKIKEDIFSEHMNNGNMDETPKRLSAVGVANSLRKKTTQDRAS